MAADTDRAKAPQAPLTPRSAAREADELRQAAEVMPQLVWVTRPDGHVEWFNGRWYAFTGSTPEHACGDGWAAYLHPDDREHTLARWRQSLATGDAYEVECRIRDAAGGGHRWFLGRALPLRRDTADGRAVSRWFGTWTDIHEQRLAREQAERASLAKSRFLDVMSHELRTPLNAIGGYAQLLDEGVHGPVNEAQRRTLARIGRAQRNLLSLIDDILRFTNLDTGRVAYDVATVDLGEVMAEAGAMVAAQAKDKGLAYEVRGPDGACPVWADRDKLTRVLVNLLSNAVKFTDRGGRIEADVVERPEAPERVDVRVRDSGIGIPADMLDAVFEPFVQADGSHTRTHEGLGLGLAISRELACGMGGELAVCSTPHEGTTVTVTLRRAVDVDGARTDRRGRGRRRADRRATDDRRRETG